MRLARDQVEPFLHFLFGSVAVRPASVELRETAAAVRYLRFLALYGVPNAVAGQGKAAIARYWNESRDHHQRSRRRLELIAKALWGLLLNSGRIERCTRVEAKNLLAKHSETYLAPFPYLDDVIAAVDELALPPDDEMQALRPTLVSSNLTSYVPINSQQPDDLSERIYAGFHALRDAGIRSAAVRISEALRARGRLRLRQDESGSREWSPNAVRERMRSYEKGLRKGGKAAGASVKATAILHSHRQWLTQKWLSSFRYHTNPPHY
jgi:hypothetical protein